MATFHSELQSIINRYSLENGSDTPDYVLAYFLRGCLEQFDAAVNARTRHSSEQEESPSGSPASTVQHSQHAIPECNGGGCHVAYKCNNRRGSKECDELRANG